MKSLLRALLIGGGIIGMFITGPIAYFVWLTRGILDSDEQWILWMYGVGLPGLCLTAVVAGVRWKDEASVDGSDASEKKDTRGENA